MNTSGCDCFPDDCDQANRSFEQLEHFTEHCFLNGNNPINNVARRIRNDAGHLRDMIKKLEREARLRQNQGLDDDALKCPFDYSAINAIIITDNKWCNY